MKHHTKHPPTLTIIHTGIHTASDDGSCAYPLPETPQPDAADASSTESGKKKKLGLDKDALARGLWVFRWTYMGRTWTLRKREESREAPWWLFAEINGLRIRNSMDTNKAESAITHAEVKFIKPAMEGRWEDVKKAGRGETLAKLGVVIAAYEEMMLGKIDPTSIRTNVNAIRAVVRRGMGNDKMEPEKVAEVSASWLGERVVLQFEDWMTRDAMKTGRDREANKRTVEAYLRNARSLFKKTLLPRYALKGIKLPDMTAFLNTEVERSTDVQHVQPPDDLVQRTLDAAVRLREDNRAAYIAWMLGYSTLRRKEISIMKWDWLGVVDGKPVITFPAKVRAGNTETTKGGRPDQIPLDPEVAAELAEYKVMRCVGDDPEDEAYVLPSPDRGWGLRYLRARGTFLKVNAWMRALGWKSQHTLHEMRAVMGAKVLKASKSWDITQGLLRHKYQKVTKKNYTGTMPLDGIEVSLSLRKA